MGATIQASSHVRHTPLVQQRDQEVSSRKENVHPGKQTAFTFWTKGSSFPNYRPPGFIVTADVLEQLNGKARCWAWGCIRLHLMQYCVSGFLRWTVEGEVLRKGPASTRDLKIISLISVTYNPNKELNSCLPLGLQIP